MHLTTHTDYAIRVLVYLALAGERRVTIGDIARAYGISENHLMKVGQHLARAGWVVSTRGRRGGISLNPRPENIVLGEVIRDMETGFALVACQADDKDCVISPFCRLRGILDEALDAFLVKLDRYTLADLIASDMRPDLERQLFGD